MIRNTDGGKTGPVAPGRGSFWRIVLPIAVLVAVQVFRFSATRSQIQLPDAPPPPSASYLAAASKAEQIADPMQRCLAYPDLPGNVWPKGAGQARCYISDDPKPSLGELAGLLAQPDGIKQLDTRYASILLAHYADPHHGDGLFNAFDGYETVEGSELADAWYAKDPDSAYARLAKAASLVAAASRARGTDYERNTSSAQLAAMHSLFVQAEPLLDQVTKSQPRLSPACVYQMVMYRLDSQWRKYRAAGKHCLKVDPLSFQVQHEWLYQFDTRWGGKSAALERAAMELKPLYASSPVLSSLLAEAAGRRVYLRVDDDLKLAPIAVMLDRVAMLGPDPFYIARAGLGAEQTGHLEKAMAYASQAVRLAPMDPNILMVRAKMRMRHADPTGALADVRRAAAAAASACDACSDHVDIGLRFAQLGDAASARAEYTLGMRDPVDTETAEVMLCQTWFSGPPEGKAKADTCSADLVNRYPNNHRALYDRASFLYYVKDPRAVEMAQRLRKMIADSNDPDDHALLLQLNALERSSPRPGAPDPTTVTAAPHNDHEIYANASLYRLELNFCQDTSDPAQIAAGQKAYVSWLNSRMPAIKRYQKTPGFNSCPPSECSTPPPDPLSAPMKDSHDKIDPAEAASECRQVIGDLEKDTPTANGAPSP